MSTLLLIGSGGALYRRYALESLASRYKLVLVDGAEPTWQRPYLFDALVAPMTDHPRVLDMGEAFGRQHAVEGVFSYEESSIGLAAALAQRLGTPSMSPAAASACRDKHQMRLALERAGIDSCQSILVHTLEECSAAAHRIGYPIVLKPRGLAASLGVIRIGDASSLASAFEFAAQSRHPRFVTEGGVLVEEYLDGPEFSAECVVDGPRVNVAAITRKRLGFAPYFEEIGHAVAPGEPIGLEPEIAELAIRIHHALGVTRGVTHLEWRSTSRGPRVIELNGRLGGDLIPYLAKLASGIDLTLAAASLCVGEKPTLAVDRHRAAIVRFLYPPHAGVVQRLEMDASARQAPGISSFDWEVEVGERITLPPEGLSWRLAVLVVEGASIAECESTADEFVRHLIIERGSPGRSDSFPGFLSGTLRG